MDKKLPVLWLSLGPGDLVRIAGWAKPGHEKRVKEMGGELYIPAARIRELREYLNVHADCLRHSGSEQGRREAEVRSQCAEILGIFLIDCEKE